MKTRSVVASAEGRAAAAMADQHHWFSAQPHKAVVGPHSPWSPVAPHSGRLPFALRVPRFSIAACRLRRVLPSRAVLRPAQLEERVSARWE